MALLLAEALCCNSFTIGVLLENFSIFYNDDDTRLNRSTIKDFKHKWRLFNSDSDVSSN